MSFKSSIMKPSDLSRLPAILKTSAVATLSLAAAVANAQSHGNDAGFEYPYDEQFEEIDYLPDSSDWNASVSTEFFGGIASKNLEDKHGTSADVYGANLKFSMRRNSNGVLVPEFYLLTGIAFGESGGFKEGPDPRSPNSATYNVAYGELSAGSNIRWQISDSFSLAFGGRIGLGVLSVSDGYEYGGFELTTSYGNDFVDEKNFAAGLSYAVGVEVEWKFNENNALTFAWNYAGCSAKPEEFDGEEKIKINAQAWSVFSIGYKYLF